MRKLAWSSLLLVLIIGAFLVGSWYARPVGESSRTPGVRKVLYYMDPMNPAFRSDKPGVAPCGMDLVPVFADGSVGGTGTSGSPLPPGTVNVSPNKQQLTGVRIRSVEKAARTHTLRILGRVSADETLIYRINAAVDGWIQGTFANSTGTLVKKDEVVASYYSPEFIGAQQAYIFALISLDRLLATGRETPEQVALTKTNIKQVQNSLRNLGMGDLQLEEIAKTRQYTESIHIFAPATGFVLVRNVSPGQRFDKGTELYRIADLSRVWILADMYDNEAEYLKPGTMVKASLPNQQRIFHAKVTNILPQFDPTSRTLKVRLEADNPGYFLRPDMFADLEVPVIRPPTISVPAEAVLDSGVKQTVFVDRGEGIFEPRAVKTGWRYGDRVEILDGLKEGERIVVSGTFLLDSESRMKAPAGAQDNVHDGQMHPADSPMEALISGSVGHTQEGHIHSVAEAMEMVTAAHAAATATDPICGMEVDIEKATAKGLTATYHGKQYYFCRLDCKEKFLKDPERYAAALAKPSDPHGSHMPGSRQP